MRRAKVADFRPARLLLIQGAMSLADHVLVATDFSSPSKRAARAVAALADGLAPATPRITLYHAVAPLPLGRMSPFVPFGTSEEGLVADLRKRARDELRATREECFDDALAVQMLESEHAHPAVAVCDTAEHLDADLVVAGTHGLTGLERAIYGSVAARVLRHAPTDVLLVPKDHDVAQFPPAKILVATDFSRSAKRAVAAAARWARALGASVDLLHVVSLGPVRQAGWGWAFPPDMAEHARTMKKRAEEGLEALAAELLAGVPAVSTSATVGTSAVERGIADHAEAIDASLIVCGSVGRTEMRRLLLGSVAEGLGRTSCVPVLCVRNGAT